MAATALAETLAGAHVRPDVRVSESRTFYAAIALIALHIVDDEFLQPPSGTAIQDHLLAGLLPIGVALTAASVYPRLRAGLRAGIALIFGILTFVAGTIAFGSASADGISGSDWSGLLLLPTGLMLIAMAAWIPWHERGRQAETARRRWLNRAVAIAVTPLVLRPRAGSRRARTQGYRGASHRTLSRAGAMASGSCPGQAGWSWRR